MQMTLGHCYLIGRDWDKNPIAIDHAKARYWLEKANTKGVGTASFLLGTIYEEGLGTDHDIEKAINMYEKAAKTEHLYALQNLARIYASAKGVPQDIAVAVKWYKKILSLDLGRESSTHNASISTVIQEAKKYIAINS